MRTLWLVPVMRQRVGVLGEEGEGRREGEGVVREEGEGLEELGREEHFELWGLRG